jgi:hypothetical protein
MVCDRCVVVSLDKFSAASHIVKTIAAMVTLRVRKLCCLLTHVVR